MLPSKEVLTIPSYQLKTKIMSATGFGIVDYLIFALALLASAGVGIYHAWKSQRVVSRARTSDEHTTTTQTAEFLMGNRKLPIMPVALSVLTTFISGLSLLGIPAEIYQRGTLLILGIYGVR